MDPKILVVDDNEDNRYTLVRRLRREGYSNVVVAENGRHALDVIETDSIDLVLLDIMMPEMNGYDVLERIKAHPSWREIPVIMISAIEDIDSVVRCIALGAEDYLPKPFNARELMARIRAVLRRERVSRQGPERLEAGDVIIDTGAREVLCANRPVALTTLEFDILEMLVRAAGRVLTRDQIMEKLYDRTLSPFDRSIDVHVSHLRKKLGTDVPRIKTVRGNGYQFMRSRGGI